MGVKQLFDLAGKVALITGGSRGLGLQMAEAIGELGAKLAITARKQGELDEASSHLKKLGLEVLTIAGDLSHFDKIPQLVDQILSKFGGIDILMYVAGIVQALPFNRTEESDWDKILNVNLKGAFLAARAVVPYMIKQKRGKLIFMSSTNACDAEAELASYNASKAGLYMLCKTLARELGHYGITSNAVAPGVIRTRMAEPILKDPRFMKRYEAEIPAGRLGNPEDVAGPATFLASHDADYVNGVLLFVDGGLLA